MGLNCALSFSLSTSVSKDKRPSIEGEGGRRWRWARREFADRAIWRLENEKEREKGRKHQTDRRTDRPTHRAKWESPGRPSFLPSVGRAYINNCNWPSPVDFARKLAHARTYVLGTMKRQRRRRRRRSGEGMRCPAPSLAGSLARPGRPTDSRSDVDCYRLKENERSGQAS